MLRGAVGCMLDGFSEAALQHSVLIVQKESYANKRAFFHGSSWVVDESTALCVRLSPRVLLSKRHPNLMYLDRRLLSFSMHLTPKDSNSDQTKTMATWLSRCILLSQPALKFLRIQQVKRYVRLVQSAWLSR